MTSLAYCTFIYSLGRTSSVAFVFVHAKKRDHFIRSTPASKRLCFYRPMSNIYMW